MSGDTRSNVVERNQRVATERVRRPKLEILAMESGNPFSYFDEEDGLTVVHMARRDVVDWKMGEGSVVHSQLESDAVTVAGQRKENRYTAITPVGNEEFKVVCYQPHEDGGLVSRVKCFKRGIGVENWESIDDVDIELLATTIGLLDRVYGVYGNSDKTIGQMMLGDVISGTNKWYFARHDSFVFDWVLMKGQPVVSELIGLQMEVNGLGLRVGSDSFEVEMKDADAELSVGYGLDEDGKNVSRGLAVRVGDEEYLVEGGVVVKTMVGGINGGEGWRVDSENLPAVESEQQRQLFERLSGEIKAVVALLETVVGKVGIAGLGISSFDGFLGGAEKYGVSTDALIEMGVLAGDLFGDQLRGLRTLSCRLERMFMTQEERDLDLLRKQYGPRVARVELRAVDLPDYVRDKGIEVFLYSVKGVTTAGLAATAPVDGRIMVTIFPDLLAERVRGYTEGVVESGGELDARLDDVKVFDRYSGIGGFDKFYDYTRSLVMVEAKEAGVAVAEELMGRVRNHELWHGTDNSQGHDVGAELAAELAAYSEATDPRILFWDMFRNHRVDVFMRLQETVNENIHETMRENTRLSVIGQILAIDLFCRLFMGEPLFDGSDGRGDFSVVHNRLRKIVRATPEELQHVRERLKQELGRYGKLGVDEWLSELGYKDLKH